MGSEDYTECLCKGKEVTTRPGPRVRVYVCGVYRLTLMRVVVRPPLGAAVAGVGPALPAFVIPYR